MGTKGTRPRIFERSRRFRMRLTAAFMSNRERPPYGTNIPLGMTEQRVHCGRWTTILIASPTLGALDVSLNIEANVVAGWQFHIYLIVEGENDAVLQKAIKDALRPEPTALAPYDFRGVSDSLSAVTYLYKGVFKRRSGYNDSKGNHRTKDQPLKGPDLRELLPFLAKHKVGARLILSGVRRNGQRLAFTTNNGSSASQATIKRKAA
jgi:hypothetical protein